MFGRRLRVFAFTAAFFTLPACGDDGGLPSSAAFPPQPTVSACLSPVPSPEDLDADGAARIEGTVVEQGVGYAPDHCFGHAVGHDLVPEGAAGSQWFRLRDASGNERIAGIHVSGSEPLAITEGETIRAVYHRLPFFGAAESLLLTRVNGDVLTWVLNTATAPIPGPAGVSIELGRRVGRDDYACGHDDLHEVRVQVNEERGSIPFHGAAQVGGMRFVNAGAGDTFYPDACHPADAPSGPWFFIAATPQP